MRLIKDTHTAKIRAPFVNGSRVDLGSISWFYTQHCLKYAVNRFNGAIKNFPTQIKDMADRGGQSALLRPGRNFIPVEAYKSGALQFDFAGTATPSLRLQPSSALYHLNKGGVAHLVIKAIKTVTVLGQLLDASGQPLRGAVVINHAGRSVSEANGFFSLEMSEGTPTIEVQHAAVSNCLFQLDAGSFRREDDSLLVGALRCAA